MRNTGIECIIFVGEATNSSKIRGLERSGAVIRRHGIDCLDTEMFAKAFAKVMCKLTVQTPEGRRFNECLSEILPVEFQPGRKFVPLKRLDTQTALTWCRHILNMG